jgi:hypothetical protein
LVLALSSGAILFFFSELLFWARPRAGDTLMSWAATWALYSVLAFVLLVVIQHYRVASIWSLFLAGALFGWLAEGVIVQTMYEFFPLQISWTGLAWHALISVLLGWSFARQLLAEHRAYRSILFAAALGLFWAGWGISWWQEDPLQIAPPLSFFTYALSSTLFLMAGYWLYAIVSPAEFSPGKLPALLIGGLLLLYFLLVTGPAVGAAAILLPLLLAVVLLTLRRSSHQKVGAGQADVRPAHIRMANLLCLLLAPLVASSLYALAFRAGISAPTNWVVYLVMTPLGFIFFGISLFKAWLPRRPDPLA